MGIVLETEICFVALYAAFNQTELEVLCNS